MSRLAFVLYALSFALIAGGFLLVVRWLVNDFRIRTELRWEAEMEARGFEVAEETPGDAEWRRRLARWTEEARNNGGLR